MCSIRLSTVISTLSQSQIHTHTAALQNITETRTDIAKKRIEFTPITSQSTRQQLKAQRSSLLQQSPSTHPLTYCTPSTLTQTALLIAVRRARVRVRTDAKARARAKEAVTVTVTVTATIASRLS